MADDDSNDISLDNSGQELKKPNAVITVQDANIIVSLTISLEEAAMGKIELLQFPRWEMCQTCGGTGQSWRSNDGTCTNCNSKGFIERQKSLSVTIPPGIETGGRLRISGEGNMLLERVGYGDVYIYINVARHTLFERRRRNLHTVATMQKKQLAEGTEINVPTLLDGQKLMQIPPGTINESTFRLAGLGLRSIENKERGDLFVKVITPEGNAGNLAGIFKNFFDWKSSPSGGKDYNFKNRNKIKIAALIVLVVVPAAIFTGFSNSSINISRESQNQNVNIRPTPKTPTPMLTVTTQTTPAAVRTPVSLPNGSEIVPRQGPRGDNALTIINDGESDVALKIVSSSTGKTRRFVYVRANSTAVFKNIAREVCILRIMSGEDWDKDTRKFLYYRSFYEFDKSFDFRKVRYTVSLTPGPDGTLRDVPINEADFEDK